MSIVLGAGEESVHIDFTPALSGMGEEKVVAVFNPLPHDFRVVFARSGSAMAPPSPGLAFAREKGLPMEKSAPLRHETQSLVLKAQAIRNLPGDIAQKAVRDLVTFVIQTRNDDGSWDFEGHGGNKNFVADPERRRQVEQEIIKEIKDTMSFFNQAQTAPSLDEQIDKFNEPEVKNEPVQKPAPGTGFNYTPEETVSSDPGQSDSAQSEAPKNPKK